ncbi:terminase small subunit [Mesorhizobium sp. M1406]|uniref:terminase small subunit n=1 Tax=Mesorhizobium sp. M1406 TaxID=2957099 RepID=UPI00333B6AFD
MPNSKLNIRHERFCHALAEGLPQSRAYIEAGYAARGNAAEVEASKMVRLPKVAARVAELQGKAAERAVVTIETIARQLDEDRQLALREKQASAAVAATMALAKIYGLVIDKQQIEQTVRKPMREPSQVKQMTLEQWQRRFAPKLTEQQPDDGNDAAEPEKAEPEREVGIIDAIRQHKANRRAKSGST